ncbi:MAG: hypothetical protein V5A46_03105 [Haloferacaceae archaeon]
MTLVSGDPGDFHAPEAGSDERVLAVLFEHDADGWRRRWRGTSAWEPEREAYVDVHDLARGAASAAGGDAGPSAAFGDTSAPPTSGVHVLPGGEVALTPLSRPVTAAEVVSSARKYVMGWGSEGYAPIVYVDALPGFLQDDDPESAAAALRTLGEAVSTSGGIAYAYCDVDAIGEAALERLRSPFDRVVGDEAVRNGIQPDRMDLASELFAFRREDPTKYGYLQGNWREARKGIEACDRNYPQARQVHAAIDDPDTTPRTLGAALGALVRLGVIDRWSDTVGATRYDLTAYDPGRLEAIGRILESD